MSVIKFIQPNGAYVDIYIFDDSMSCYKEEQYIEDPNLRGRFDASVHVYFPYGDFRNGYKLNKTLYFNNVGVFTYKKQKAPIFNWKPDIEKEFDGWSKNSKGYSVPLNQPRKLPKNYF